MSEDFYEPSKEEIQAMEDMRADDMIEELKIDQASISNEVQDLFGVRNQIDLLKARLKELNQEYKEKNVALTRKMEEMNIQNMKINVDGQNVTAYQNAVVRAKIIDEDAFADWANASDETGVDGFKMFSSQKVTSAMREILKSEESSLPPGVEINEFNEIRLRKG